MLNTQQLKKMASHNLVNIGSHSSSHFVMTDLEEIDQENEILNSKKFIEEIIVKPVNHFCYPYGEFNEKSKEILIKNGYKSAVTTVPRNIFKTKKEDFFCIPRYVVKCGDKNKKFLSLM
jgi:peptidoglycan/xylan/chitin deacetylase (PgdA/CDA1 family)